jgi:hypothetical protein
MSYRIFELPKKLWLDGKPSIQLLCARNKRTTAMGKIWVGKSVAFLGKSLESYQLLSTFQRFAWHGALTQDYTDETFCIDLTAGFTLQLDGPDQILPEMTDFDTLNGTNWLFVDDEIMFIGNPILKAKGQYSLQVLRGRFGTPIQSHKANSEAYIIRGKDFDPICCDYWFIGNTAKFKVVLGVQQPSDHDPIIHPFTANFLPPVSMDLTTGKPTILPGPPSGNTGILNETWRDAYLAEWRCILAGRLGGWIQTHPAMLETQNQPGSFPVNYIALNASGLQRFDGQKWVSCSPAAA